MPHSPFIHGKYSCTQCIVDTENGIYNFSHVLSSTTNNGTACEGIPGSARKGQKATKKYLWDQLRWFGDFPGGANCKEPACQCRRLKRCGFDPWVGKIPLEEGMATHSSIFAWRISWTEGPCKELDTTEATVRARTHTHTHTLFRSVILANNLKKQF